MEEQSLAELLHRADQAKPRVGDAAPLAARARQQLARQHQRRRRVVGVGSLAILFIAALAVWRGNEQVLPTTVPEPVAKVSPSESAPSSSILSHEEARAEIARLTAEAEMHARAAEMMKTALAGQRAQRELEEYRRRGDPMDWIADQQNRTALSMMMRAERLSEQPDSQAEVEATYHRIIELFPKTHTAEIVRQRLDRNDMGDRI